MAVGQPAVEGCRRWSVQICCPWSWNVLEVHLPLNPQKRIQLFTIVTLTMEITSSSEGGGAWQKLAERGEFSGEKKKNKKKNVFPF